MEIKFFKASKKVEENTDGEYIIRKFHEVRIDEPKYFLTIQDVVGDDDDYEGLFFNGVCIDFDGCIFSIQPDKFIELTENKIKELKEEFDNDEEDVGNFRELIVFLKKWVGYELYLNSEDSEVKK